MGGRVSEKLFFDELTTGAAQDLKTATQLAGKMVCQWGMSDMLGPVTYSRGEEHVFLGHELAQHKDFSEHTAQLIDNETRRIVREMEERTTALLMGNRTKLDRLAHELMRQETLMKNDIDRILELG